MSDEELAVTENAEVEKPEVSEIVETSEPTPEQEKTENEPERPNKVQRRIDRLTREKNEAMAEAKYLKEMLNQGKETPKEEFASLERENYSSDREWIEAIADAKAEQKAKVIIEAQARERYQAEEGAKRQTVEQKANKIFAEAAKLGDFDEEDFNEIPYTAAMSEAILESDVGAAIVHHLASNPDLVDRLSSMSPARQAAEIGKLEITLADKQPVKKSAAPTPIKPVSGGGGTFKGLSDQMDADTWLRERNKQLRENR